MPSKRVLVTYVYHKYSATVAAFLSQPVFPQSIGDYSFDYLVVANTAGALFEPIPTLPPYFKFERRENVGFDFGAYSHALLAAAADAAGSARYRAYDAFIFLNSSAIGPFAGSEAEVKIWPLRFLDRLDATTKLVGSTINCANMHAQLNPAAFAHVQSFAFALDREGVEACIRGGIFSLTMHEATLPDTVVRREIGMSRLLIGLGYNIGCLMRVYEGRDFRRAPATAGVGVWTGDIMWPGAYYGGNIPAGEVMFMKNNRGF